MNHDVNALYPALSALAKIYNKDLNELAKKSSHHDNYLGLADCCYVVFNGLSTRSGAVCANYLATLNEYVLYLDHSAADYVWKQLVSGPRSTFLDTLGEATWYLHFKNKGYGVTTHVPFEDNNRSSGDVDLVVTAETTEWWLDVYSTGATLPKIPDNRPGPHRAYGRKLEDVVMEIDKKAQKKFHDKFSSTVRTGRSKGKLLGLLICIQKEDHAFLLPLYNAQISGKDVSPPFDLFTEKRNGLHVVLVKYTKRTKRFEILQPVILCQWCRK